MTLARPKALTRRIGALLPAVGIIGVFMVLPMLVVAVYSFLEADPYGGVEPIFSTQAYEQFVFERTLADELVFNDAYLTIFGRSLLLAMATTVICVLIGFPVAYYMAMQPPERQNTLVLLVTVPFWTNLLIRIYCWILILRDGGVINSALLDVGLIDRPVPLLYTNFAILLGLVYVYIPFMILPVYASLARLDLRLVEAAHDLYANRAAALRHIVVPLAIPGIVAGGILVFIPSLGNFIAPDLLGGGQRLMIGSLIQLQFSTARDWPFGSAAALILLAAVLISLTAIARGSTMRALQQGLR